MAYLSEWLQIMLGEIARKQEEAQRATAEDEQRRRDAQSVPQSVPEGSPSTPPAPPYLSTQTPT